MNNKSKIRNYVKIIGARKLMKTKDKPIIYIIGPSFKTQGGISSVLSIYNINFKDSLNMRFISSYSGDLRIKDLLFFSLALIQVFFICIFKKQVIFHIHSSTYGSYLRKSIIAWICLKFGKKVIFHIHGADFDSFLEDARVSLRKKIIKLLNAVDELVVLSDSWYRFFSAYVSSEKVRVIFNPSATYSNTYIKRANKKVKVLFMGRIGQRKGAYDLINAVTKIRFLNFTLDLVGDGEGNKLRNIVNNENLNNLVNIHDWVPHDKVGKLYDEADILVLPSYAEGMPMSILEAVGKGLPVIATNVGGIPEVVIDGRNGFVISPGDIEALAGKLEILIRDAILREEMGRNGLRLAGEKFSIDKIYSQLKELYNTLY